MTHDHPILLTVINALPGVFFWQQTSAHIELNLHQGLRGCLGKDVEGEGVGGGNKLSWN